MSQRHISNINSFVTGQGRKQWHFAFDVVTLSIITTCSGRLDKFFLLDVFVSQSNDIPGHAANHYISRSNTWAVFWRVIVIWRRLVLRCQHFGSSTTCNNPHELGPTLKWCLILLPLSSRGYLALYLTMYQTTLNGIFLLLTRWNNSVSLPLN